MGSSEPRIARAAPLVRALALHDRLWLGQAKSIVLLVRAVFLRSSATLDTDTLRNVSCERGAVLSAHSARCGVPKFVAASCRLGIWRTADSLSL